MKIKDLNIYVEGVGTPIILLHGWNQNAKMMEPLFEHFKKTNKVCNLDLPGFGNSKKLEYSYSIYDYVVVIKEVIKTYHLENPIIIAHSFGARIAFHYASFFPCRYLIITGGAGILPKRGFHYYLKVYLYKFLHSLNVNVNMGSEDYRNASDVMKSTLVKVVNEDASNAIIKIKCPILLVWGEHDTQTPLWMAKKITNLNANATLVVFKKDDHFAYYHQIKRFIKVCESTLKGCE